MSLPSTEEWAGRLASLCVIGLAAVLYQDQPSPALYQQEEGPPRPSRAAGLDELLPGPRCPVAPIAVPELPLGRYVMSRLAGFYIAKAIESAAGGTTEAAASRTPPRRAVDHAALDATSSHDRSASILQLVAAAVHRIIGGLGKASRGHRRLNHLRVPPREPARQPSAR
jgi:hypothetical protein